MNWSIKEFGMIVTSDIPSACNEILFIKISDLPLIHKNLLVVHIIAHINSLGNSLFSGVAAFRTIVDTVDNVDGN
jgi:hypothetical protein